MKKRKIRNEKGITLVVLVITIIILLILAGITIMQITKSGLVNNTQLAKEKHENAQLKENEILSQYEKYTSNSREQITIDKNEYEDLKNKVESITGKMSSPNLLVTASLPETSSSTRDAGEYKASSNLYTKTNTNIFNDYLELQEGKGWKIKKSGWYYIKNLSHAEPNNNNGGVYCVLSINGTIHELSHAYINPGVYYTAMDNPSATLWFNEGDIIDYSYHIGNKFTWSMSTLYIYALFNL